MYSLETSVYREQTCEEKHGNRLDEYKGESWLQGRSQDLVSGVGGGGVVLGARELRKGARVPLTILLVETSVAPPPPLLRHWLVAYQEAREFHSVSWHLLDLNGRGGDVVGVAHHNTNRCESCHTWKRRFSVVFASRNVLLYRMKSRRE